MNNFNRVNIISYIDIVNRGSMQTNREQLDVLKVDITIQQTRPNVRDEIIENWTFPICAIEQSRGGHSNDRYVPQRMP